MKKLGVFVGILVLVAGYVACSPTVTNPDADAGVESSTGTESTAADASTESQPGDTSSVESQASESSSPDNQTVDQAPAGVCFSRDIMPLLLSNCAKSGCHDSLTHAEGINLSNYNSILSSRSVVSGNAARSELYQVIVSSGRKAMPPAPAARLSAEQIDLIKRWIDEGAKNTTCSDTGTCDTNNVTYSKVIQPILQKYCVGCHSQSVPTGGIKLDSYDGAKSAASGRLYVSVSRQTGAKPMPPSGDPLPACDVSKIKSWIDNGMPQ